MHFKMKGIVPPMLTPFKKDGKLDVKNLEALVDFLKENVDGLFICGSYGSGPLMRVEERKKVAEVTIKRVDGKIPVIVQTGTTNTADTTELAQHAEALGCNAVAAVAPYYYVHNQDNIIEFYTSLLKAVGRNYPVYIYQNPKFSGYEINLDTLKRLKEAGIRGIKDATFNILTHATYIRELADDNFDVVLGTEAMWLSARALGCEAFIPGLANAFPEICAKMYREGMNNDYEACRKTQFQVNKVRDIMYLAKSTQLAIYAMLKVRGIVETFPRSPFVPASEQEIGLIKKELQKLGMV